MYLRRATALGGFLVLFGLVSLGPLLVAALPGPWSAHAALHVGWAALLAAAGISLADRAVRRTAARFRALNELARRTVPPVDLQTALDQGLTRLVLLTGADAGCLRLQDGDGCLVTAASLRCDASYLRQHGRVEPQGGAEKALLACSEPALLPPGAVSPGLDNLLGRAPCAVVLLPLTAGDTVHGLVTLAFARRRRLLEEDREVMKAVATQIVVAIVGVRLHEELIQESRTDSLTGLGSRRHFDDLFRRELARARRSHRPLSLAMIDIDMMKQINDERGHVTGDRVLEAVGRLLKRVRAGDVVARYGGDEFVILMPETTLSEAEAVAFRIRERLEQFNCERHFPFPVRISIGVRQMSDPDADLLAEADAAMYRDKRHRGAPARAAAEAVEGEEETAEPAPGSLLA